MKVLLILPPILNADGNVRRVPCNFPGLGLAQIAGFLRWHGHDAQVLDLSESSPQALSLLLPEIVADMVGVSVFSEAVSGTAVILDVLQRTRPQVPVVLGGHHVTHLPDELLRRYSNVTAVVRGDGERPLLQIVEALEAGAAIPDTRGIVTRGRRGDRCGVHRHEEVLSVPAEHIHLQDICFPVDVYARRLHPSCERSRLSWLERCGWREGDLAAGVLTARGCPHRCRFCSFEITHGLRFAELDAVWEMLQTLHDRGVRVLVFYDAVFLADPRRTERLCLGMIERGWNFRWTAQTVAAHTERELGLIPLMKRAGLVEMAIGLESGSERIRQSMGKQSAPIPVQSVVAAYMTSDILVNVNLLIGSPDEDDASFRETCALLYDLPGGCIEGVKQLQLYPGSHWYRTAVQQGVVSRDWDWAAAGVPRAPFHRADTLRRWEELFQCHRECADRLPDAPAGIDTLVLAGATTVEARDAVLDAVRWRYPCLKHCVTQSAVPDTLLPEAVCAVAFEPEALGWLLPKLRGSRRAMVLEVLASGAWPRLHAVPLEAPSPQEQLGPLYADWQAFLFMVAEEESPAFRAEAILEAQAVLRRRWEALHGRRREVHLPLVSAWTPAPPTETVAAGTAGGGQGDELYDRLLGALCGRIAGCVLGVPCEGMTREEIRNAVLATGQTYPLESYWALDPKPHLGPDALHYRRSPRRRFLAGQMSPIGADDDLMYSILGLLVLERHGRWPTASHIAATWRELLPFACTAESAALANLHAGLEPPETARRHNPYTNWVGAIIRADPWAWAHPGSPADAMRIAERDASISHTGAGAAAAAFVAATISLAFVCSHPYEAARRALGLLSPVSPIVQPIREALRLCDTAADWESGIRQAEKRWGHLPPGHVVRNLPILLAGLAWGEADLGNTIAKVVMGGADTDSNAATAGSIVGAVRGFAASSSPWDSLRTAGMDSYLVGHPSFGVEDIARRFWKLHQTAGSR